jgi:FecR protein
MRKSELPAILLAVAAVSAYGQDPARNQTQDPAQDPPSRVARLNYINGTVSFRPGSIDEWTAATINYPIYNGDHLWADREARTELHVGSTALRMGPETALAILNLDDRMVQLSLTGGTLHVRLRALGEGESFEVDTPNAAVTLLRAGEYRFFVDGDRNLTTVTVRGGDAEVTGGGRAFTLHARDSARFIGSDDSFSSQLDPAPLPDEFEIWC